MNFSGIIGLILFWGFPCLAIVLSGSPLLFLDPQSGMIVFWVVVGAGLTMFGLRDFLGGVLALRALVVQAPVEALEPRNARVLRGLVPPAYAAGAVGSTICVVNLLNGLANPAHIGTPLAISCLPAFYSVMLAEGLLRPGARLIEHRASDGGGSLNESR